MTPQEIDALKMQLATATKNARVAEERAAETERLRLVAEKQAKMAEQRAVFEALQREEAEASARRARGLTLLVGIGALAVVSTASE